MNRTQLALRNPSGLVDTVISKNNEIYDWLKPESYHPDLVRAVAKFCYNKKNIAQAIFVTGDLATTGLLRDMKVAEEYISSIPYNKYVNGYDFPTLAASDLDIVVLPGNHDNYSDDDGNPGNRKTFELAFEDFIPNYNNGVGDAIFDIGDESIGFILADFSLSVAAQSRKHITDVLNLTKKGRGIVHRPIYDELIKRTVQHRKETKNSIWLIHFAPFPCKSMLELIDFPTIIEGAQKVGVKTIICGHTHENSKHEIDEVTVYCGGAAGSIDSINDCRIQFFDIELPSGKVVRDNYKYKLGDTKFEIWKTDG